MIENTSHAKAWLVTSNHMTFPSGWMVVTKIEMESRDRLRLFLRMRSTKTSMEKLNTLL